MSHTDYWTKHLSNINEVRSLFPQGGLILSDLQLLGLEYVPGNKLLVKLLSDRLPDDVPQRWRDRGAKGIEICLDAGVSSLSMWVPKEFDEMPRLSVSIDENWIRVVAQGTEGSFKIEASTFYVRLDAKPSIERT